MIGRLGAVGLVAAALAVTITTGAFGQIGPVSAAPGVESGGPGALLGPYVPPACTGLFADVACPGGFAVNWIEQFYNDGITAGCGTGVYCPDNPVTRAQMAVFVEKAMRGTANWPPHTQLVWAVKNADGTPNPSASGSALLAAVAAIPTVGNDVPSGTNPWLLKVGPGIYDLGAGSLALPAYTALEGAGREITVITATGYADNTHGTVMVGDRGRLAHLTVANTGGSTFEIPVFLPQNSLSVGLEHVALLGSNPSNASGMAYGMRTDTNTSFKLVDCVLTVHGAGTNYGIVANSTQNKWWVDSTHIDVYGAGASGTDYGIFATSADVAVTDSRLSISDGAGQYGIYAVGGGGGGLVLRDLEIYTDGGGAAVYIDSIDATLVGDIIVSGAGYGISTNGSGYTAGITASTITGGTNWLYNGAGHTTTVGASKLVGTTVNAGTVMCFGNYTNSAFLASTCP